MNALPVWMRTALLATAVLNIAGAAVFSPFGDAVRAAAHVPEAGHPLYAGTVGLFIGTFGAGYLYAGVTGRSDRLFISVAAVGKLLFFGLLAVLWLLGDVSPRLALLGSADLAFGAVFVYWLAVSARDRRPSA